MTKKDWLGESSMAQNPLHLFHMLNFIVSKRSKRKLYLFGCACCRRAQDFLTDRTRNVVRLVEEYADSANKETLTAAISEAKTEFRAVLNTALKEVTNSRSSYYGAFLEAMTPSLAQRYIAANAVVQFAMEYTVSTACSTAHFCASLLGN